MDKIWEKSINELNSINKEWWTQLKKLNNHIIDLNSNNYSLPYFMNIPENWFKSNKIKILIVGEEARGDWNKENYRAWGIEDITNWAKEHQQEQLTVATKSTFWKRVKRICDIDKEKIVCAWTNLDKIHHNGTINCSLNNVERKLLHSTDIKILAEEIRILKPNIVLFCGYYKRRLAMESEITTVAKKFYGKEGKDYISLFNEKIYQVRDSNIIYLFTQHPTGRTNLYEEKICVAIKNAMTELKQ